MGSPKGGSGLPRMGGPPRHEAFPRCPTTGGKAKNQPRCSKSVITSEDSAALCGASSGPVHTCISVPAKGSGLWGDPPRDMCLSNFSPMTQSIVRNTGRRELLKRPAESGAFQFAFALAFFHQLIILSFKKPFKERILDNNNPKKKFPALTRIQQIHP